jgi:hypothetical protein
MSAVLFITFYNPLVLVTQGGIVTPEDFFAESLSIISRRHVGPTDEA